MHVCAIKHCISEQCHDLSPLLLLLLLLSPFLSPFLPPLLLSPFFFSPPSLSPPTSGELDDIPEVAFYMVGPIEEVLEVAEKLAQQQQ